MAAESKKWRPDCIVTACEPGKRFAFDVKAGPWSHQGLTNAQAGSGPADPGPDTLWTLARALDGLFAVLAGTLEPDYSRHCADRYW